MKLLDALRPQALDPIMAGFAEFAADPRPDKVNLGIGMDHDDGGRIPILDVVGKAEHRVAPRITSWDYLQPEGHPGLRDAARRLVFGDDHADRITTVQSLGGTGALKLGADIIRRLDPDATVAMSSPTWGNHPAIFGGAGLRVASYPYFDPATGDADWPAMREAVAAMPPGTVLLLHACCHNPTGADLPPDAWDELAALIAKRQLIPFLDMAYAGFADGLEPDTSPARLLADRGVPLFVAISFSKSFALYGERTGALAIVAPDPGQARMLFDQAKVAIRTNYSTPPTHGALLVAEILGDPELAASWRTELDGMRQRIRTMREGLVARLEGNNARNFDRLVRQRGLFSFSGLSPAEMTRLKTEFGIYGISDGRLCMAALTPQTLDRVAAGIRTVVS